MKDAMAQQTRMGIDQSHPRIDHYSVQSDLTQIHEREPNQQTKQESVIHACECGDCGNCFLQADIVKQAEIYANGKQNVVTLTLGGSSLFQRRMEQLGINQPGEWRLGKAAKRQ